MEQTMRDWYLDELRESDTSNLVDALNSFLEQNYYGRIYALDEDIINDYFSGKTPCELLEEFKDCEISLYDDWLIEDSNGELKSGDDSDIRELIYDYENELIKYWSDKYVDTFYFDLDNFVKHLLSNERFEDDSWEAARNDAEFVQSFIDDEMKFDPELDDEDVIDKFTDYVDGNYEYIPKPEQELDHGFQTDY